MKKLLIALLALSPMAASADGVYIGGWSHHIWGSTDNDGYKYNERHDLIAVEHKNIFVGTMINSYDTRSYVAGYSFTLRESKHIDFRVLLGAVHGYTEAQNDFFRVGSLNVFAAPVIEFNTPFIEPTIMLFGEAVTLTFKYEY